MRDWLEEEHKKETILEIAEYIIDNDATVRNASDNLLIPKTTIHRYMVKELKHLNIELYDQVRTIFNRHYKERVPRMIKSQWNKRGIRK